MYKRPLRIVVLSFGLACAGVGPVGAQQNEAPPDDQDAKAQAGGKLPGPPDIPVVSLASTLKTVPVPHNKTAFNVHMVDASLLPRDKEGIWVLDFAFKPMRLLTIEVPGKGRKIVHYLYYKVVNRTGKPRLFVPQFTLITDTGQRVEEAVLPHAVELVRAREDPSIPLLGTVGVVGMIPPTKKQGVDDAVYGVAMWMDVDPKADGYKVYVRGLSDGYQEVPAPDGSKSVTRYKTLRIDFLRRGDERNLNEKEIQLNEPPYEWIYW